MIEAILELHDDDPHAQRLTGQATQLSRGPTWDLFLIRSSDTDSLESDLRAWEAWTGQATRHLETTEASAVIEAKSPHARVLDHWEHHRCRPLWPSRIHGPTTTYRLLAPDRRALTAATELPGPAPRLRVASLAPASASDLDLPVPIGDLARDLTRRQLEVLTHAMRGGYYEVPRETTAGCLAQALGISASTLTEHLRKAERAALQAFVRTVAEHPALDDEHLRSIGRPAADRVPVSTW